ncbi:hypothetical protein OSTOST_14900 [Ostertagia ostertagi]
MTSEATIPDSEKVRIVSDFLQHAPPGEFNEVFNAVRMLLNNDQLLKEGCAQAITKYNESQFAPVKLEGVEKQTLVTPFNDIGGGRYVDDASKKSSSMITFARKLLIITLITADIGVLRNRGAMLCKRN